MNETMVLRIDREQWAALNFAIGWLLSTSNTHPNADIAHAMAEKLASIENICKDWELS